jgi:hypothetical protein
MSNGNYCSRCNIALPAEDVLGAGHRSRRLAVKGSYPQFRRAPQDLTHQ